MGQRESMHNNRATLERMMEIVTNGEYGALEEVLHLDFVQVIPQSGERVVGVENFRKILENLPGGGRA